MNRQLTKATAEGHLLLQADVLIANDNHLMLNQRLVDHRKIGIGQMRQIHPMQKSTDIAVDRLNVNRRLCSLGRCDRCHGQSPISRSVSQAVIIEQ